MTKGVLKGSDSKYQSQKKAFQISYYKNKKTLQQKKKEKRKQHLTHKWCDLNASSAFPTSVSLS